MPDLNGKQHRLHTAIIIDIRAEYQQHYKDRPSVYSAPPVARATMAQSTFSIPKAPSKALLARTVDHLAVVVRNPLYRTLLL